MPRLPCCSRCRSAEQRPEWHRTVALSSSSSVSPALLPTAADSTGTPAPMAGGNDFPRPVVSTPPAAWLAGPLDSDVYSDGDEPDRGWCWFADVSFCSWRSSDSNWISDEERLSDAYDRLSESIMSNLVES
uniref:Uncharacterized protein n=1 Tax=Anopheles melas TaxID=34690 RepID=A0A182UDW1_9DIPT